MLTDGEEIFSADRRYSIGLIDFRSEDLLRNKPDHPSTEVILD